RPSWISPSTSALAGCRRRPCGGGSTSGTGSPPRVSCGGGCMAGGGYCQGWWRDEKPKPCSYKSPVARTASLDRNCLSHPADTDEVALRAAAFSITAFSRPPMKIAIPYAGCSRGNLLFGLGEGEFIQGDM